MTLVTRAFLFYQHSVACVDKDNGPLKKKKRVTHKPGEHHYGMACIAKPNSLLLIKNYMVSSSDMASSSSAASPMAGDGVSMLCGMP